MLTDPSRRRILDLLREREHLVGELVDDLGLSQPGRLQAPAGAARGGAGARAGRRAAALVRARPGAAGRGRPLAGAVPALLGRSARPARASPRRVVNGRRAVVSSAGKKDSIASSETVTSSAVANARAGAEEASAPSISSGTKTSCAAGLAVRPGIAAAAPRRARAASSSPVTSTWTREVAQQVRAPLAEVGDPRRHALGVQREPEHVDRRLEQVRRDAGGQQRDRARWRRRGSSRGRRRSPGTARGS